MRLDPEQCLAVMERASPAALGIAASTFSNQVACVRAVLRRLGLLAPRRVRTPSVPSAAMTIGDAAPRKLP